MNLSNIKELIYSELGVYFNGHEEEIAEQPSGYIDELSKSEKSIKIVFDQINFKILNISENVKNVTEFSASQLRNKHIFSYFHIIALEHFFFLYVWLNWVNKLVKKYARTQLVQGSTATFCGIKVKQKSGHYSRIMIRQVGHEYLPDGAMKISIISIDDITHLMKSDFYWGRIEFGDAERKYIHHLVSTDKKDIPNDILSNREKEIVNYLAIGMESKEIGKKIFLSSHTVDNHRRNMLAKTGARDTTALIQLCLMAGIIKSSKN